MLEQCQKYGLDRPRRDIDKRLASSIDELTRAIQPQFDSRYEALYRSDDYIFVDYDAIMFQPVRSFDLPLIEELLANYLVTVLKENNHRLELRREQKTKLNRKVLDSATRKVSEFVRQMRHSGQYRFCALFAQRIMEAERLISPA